jgi:hypothetical protein
MKITVITGKAGKIVGTYRPAPSAKPEVGTGGPIAGPGQAVHVIDLPKELENVVNADELHRGLKSHVGAAKKK